MQNHSNHKIKNSMSSLTDDIDSHSSPTKELAAKEIDNEFEISTDGSSEDEKVQERGTWGNQFEFIFACVGYAVGVGNIYRFPYLCMRNGGGAFLIPYFVCLFLTGMPLFFLELIIGQFSSRSPLKVWNICPLFKGLGYGMVVVSGIACIYYNLLLTWVLYYLVKSFTKTLPWSKCGNWWNTPLCLVRSAADSYLYGNNDTQILDRAANASSVEGVSYIPSADFDKLEAARRYANVSQNETIPWVTAAEEFWEHGILELTPGIDQLGGIKWETFGFLLLSWTIIFLCLCKGIKTSGKVVYVTATVPYVFLTLLLIRGLLLPGAMDGIKYYIIPDWSKLLDFKVWAEAYLQTFYSLGPAWGGIITLGSYNKFNRNCVRDAIIIPLVNSCTSFYGGFVIFSIIGFMANQAGLQVKDVIKTGPGLAFIAYPEAIANLPISPMWAIFFFVMLLTLGLGTQIGMFETMTSSLCDQFPKYLRKRRVLFTAVVCLLEFMVGIIFTTRAGLYFFQIVDWYVAAFSVLLISFLECIIVYWIYDIDRLCYDVELMTGQTPNIWWKICWGYISPLTLLLVVIYNMVAMEEPAYGDYHYPGWAIGIGWVVCLCSLVPIPVVFVKEFLSYKGTVLERLRQGLQPTEDWGPAEPQYQALYKYSKTRNFSRSALLCCGKDNLDAEEVRENKKSEALLSRV